MHLPRYYYVLCLKDVAPLLLKDKATTREGAQLCDEVSVLTYMLTLSNSAYIHMYF